nr:ATP-binding protein [uncultured Rhodoferax sp.]
MALIVALLALVCAGVALYFLERANAREQLTQELNSTARLLANRSSAALVFLDDVTAQENLQALQDLDQVRLVCLFDSSPRLFASYAPTGDSLARCADIVRSTIDPPGIVRVTVPVISKDVTAGSLVLISTTKPLQDRMWAQRTSLAIALGSAFLLATAIAVRLQRSIVEPISLVRDVATSVIETGDFGLRAPALGSKEVGKLASSFNAMLDTIARQNHELAQSETYTRRLFHDSPIPQYVLDSQTGLCIDCNQAAVAIHGFSRSEELIGKSTADFSSEYQPDGQSSTSWYQRSLQRLRTKTGTVSGEWLFQRANNVQWEGMVHAMLLSLNGREMIHVSVQDITQRKRAEADLNQLNLDLESRVNARTSELAKANSSLVAAMDTLKHTQSELLQRDKLASLGALVAGVAHELNTPLGNSILVATSLGLAAQNLGKGMREGTLTKSGAATMIEQLTEGTALMTRNLERASELIVNFKQVAVDQTSEKRRSFDLGQVLQEVIETLQPQFKHTPHTVSVDAPEGLAMDSYPGPLGQVITNLVMNGLIHAFDASRPGTMAVVARISEGDSVELIVRDTGRGIAPEHLSKVFDPFFTTRLGQGGSGLGLHIVYNIVVSTLGGDIRVHSEVGAGTTFTLHFPMNAPLAKHPVEDA